MSVTAVDTTACVWQGTLAIRVRPVGLLSVSMNYNICTCIHIFILVLVRYQVLFDT